MLKQIHHLVVWVTDMKRAKAFYEDVLGLSVGYESDTWTEIRAPESSTYIGLHFTTQTPGNGTEISFLVDDIEEAATNLKKKGVKFVSEIVQAAPGKRVVHFVDPDGNPLSLYEISS